jgi:hypothetical protein
LRLPSTTGNSANAGTPSFSASFRHRQQAVERHALDTGHRGYGFGAADAFEDENGIDQVGGGERVLSHQAPGKLVAPHPAHPC